MNLYSYEYDFTRNCLINRKIIIENQPLLLDQLYSMTINTGCLQHTGGPESNNKLYIYHANDWKLPYTPHQANPVKNTLNGSRPAGNFIHTGGKFTGQRKIVQKYYGKSITLNKITLLNELEFSEEPVFELNPPKNTNFNYAIHTINFSDDVIVINGFKKSFFTIGTIKDFFKEKINP